MTMFYLFCRKKKGKGGDKNRPISNEVPTAASEEQTPAKEPVTEADRLLMQRSVMLLVDTVFGCCLDVLHLEDM